MNKKIFLTLCVTTVIILLGFIIIRVSTIETFEHSGTITMKWNIPKLVVIHYYFEIDNITRLNVDTYDWYKYNIGDTYTWSTWE